MDPGTELRIRPLNGLGEIRPGDDVGGEIAAVTQPRDGEVVVISQKVVSKAEGRLRDLADVIPGKRARKLAGKLDKDPRVVELVLAESREVLRASHGVLIVETHQGWICANAGIDSSNVGTGSDLVALLPEDPDASARAIRAGIHAVTGALPGVIVADSFGRAWRLGQADIAIGCAGVITLDDWRGRADGDGRSLQATEVAVADQLAGAADLVRGKDSGVPGAVIEGAARFVTPEHGPGARAIIRPRDLDLFR